MHSPGRQLVEAGNNLLARKLTVEAACKSRKRRA